MFFRLIIDTVGVWLVMQLSQLSENRTAWLNSMNGFITTFGLHYSYRYIRAFDSYIFIIDNCRIPYQALKWNLSFLWRRFTKSSSFGVYPLMRLVRYHRCLFYHHSIKMRWLQNKCPLGSSDHGMIFMKWSLLQKRLTNRLIYPRYSMYDLFIYLHFGYFLGGVSTYINTAICRL